MAESRSPISLADSDIERRRGVSLPRAMAAPVAEPAAQAIAKRRGRILVVDDEPLLCMTVERVLSLDHEVVTVTAARSAVQLIEGGARFDVILSDLMMPQMSGMDLHAVLTRVAPEQAGAMVFMTGGAFSPDAAAFLEHVPNPTIDKPFKAAALRALVQGLVNSG